MILEINKTIILLERINIIKPTKVPPKEISIIGFRPYLSLSLLRIGPNINPKIAFELNKNPIIAGEALNSAIKNGKKGRIILNPKISTKTEIQRGLSWEYLFLFSIEENQKYEK